MLVFYKNKFKPLWLSESTYGRSFPGLAAIDQIPMSRAIKGPIVHLLKPINSGAFAWPLATPTAHGERLGFSRLGFERSRWRALGTNQSPGVARANCACGQRFLIVQARITSSETEATSSSRQQTPPKFQLEPSATLKFFSPRRLQSCVGSAATSLGNREPRNRRYTLNASRSTKKGQSGTYGKGTVRFAESFGGARKAETSYIDSIIIQRSQKNPPLLRWTSGAEFCAKRKSSSLQLKYLERHESGVLRTGTELCTKPSSLKGTIRLEHSCGDLGLIGEFSSAQKHCLQKFINLCMKHGKKNKSYKIISNTLQRLILADPSSHKPLAVGSPISRRAKVPSGTLVWDRSTLKKENYDEGAISCLNVSDPVVGESKLRGPLGARTVSARRKLLLLMNAIENVKPVVEVKKVRISGTTQLVPSIIPKNRQICLAIRWIVEASILRRNTKKSMTLDQCFFAELIDASQNIGTVRKRRDDLHKLAESNRGFAHYRWW